MILDIHTTKEYDVCDRVTAVLLLQLGTEKSQSAHIPVHGIYIL